MSKTVTFFFDYGSPTTYLAYTQLPRIVAHTGATLINRPILLGGVFKASGNQSPVNIAAKRDWMFKDMQRFAQRYGVPFVINPHFPINTLGLMRGAVFAAREGFLEQYSAAIFPAMWADEVNLGDVAEITRVLESAGLDAGKIIAGTNEPEIKEQLKTNTQEAVDRGVFGAPSFIIDGELFFGQDRLDFVEEALAA